MRRLALVHTQDLSFLPLSRSAAREPYGFVIQCMPSHLMSLASASASVCWKHDSLSSLDWRVAYEQGACNSQTILKTFESVGPPVFYRRECRECTIRTRGNSISWHTKIKLSSMITRFSRKPSIYDKGLEDHLLRVDIVSVPPPLSS